MATERETHPLSGKQPTLLGSRTEKELPFGEFCSPAPGGGRNPHFTDAGPDSASITSTCAAASSESWSRCCLSCRALQEASEGRAPFGSCYSVK